jgi:hypothetical protein
MIYNSLYAGEQERLESEAEISRINPIGGGRFRQSNSFSDYTRDDHSFYKGEIVSGTFVKFNKCGHYNKVYALFDLDDGRKTRVDVKYFKRMKGREAMFLPGDSVTIQFCSYSTKHDQPSWFVRKTPMRLNNKYLKIDYPTPIQRLLSNNEWLEFDSIHKLGAIKKGQIVQFKCLHGRRRFAIVEFDDGRATRVHRVSFEVHGYSIDDYQLGTCLVVKKVGFMPDRNITKWVVKNPPYQI